MNASALADAAGAKRVPRVFHSSEGKLDIANQLGMAHYSYRIVEGRFVNLLRALGYFPERIDLPPYYAARPPHAALDNATFRPIHLIFRSTENIRTMSGCYNICCFAWEFDIVKTDTLPFEHPFANQKRMLDICEEVWAPSLYTATVLRSHGVRNVHYVPAPLPPTEAITVFFDKPKHLRTLRNVASVHLKISNISHFAMGDAMVPLDARPWIREAMTANKVFLTILNPNDKRKNLQELLLGFFTVLEAHPEAVLLVKLVVSKQNSDMSISAIEDVTARFERPISLESTRIVFLFDYLSDEQMWALYAISNFYLCTSVSEGQNLPIIEAMAAGVLPVSTINTAMLDYLSSDNCVEIKTRKFSAFERETGASVVRRPYSVSFCSQTDIGRALLRACGLPRADIDRMRRNAQRTVSQKFSFEAVGALIRRRIEMIMAGAGCAHDGQ